MNLISGTFLMRLRRKITGQNGMSLIEMLVSIAIFAVVSAGVAGTLVSGLRSIVNSRISTMGQHASQQQLEDMRALPFYVPYSTDVSVGTTADVDLLDNYFPNLSTAHAVDSRNWQGWYTQGGGDAYYTKVSPADEHGITLTVVTRFVDDQFNIIVPPSSYDNHTFNADRPPSNLVKVTITASWANRGAPNSYTLDSLISSTGQPGGPSCLHASNSHVDVIGANMIGSAGTNILNIDLDTTLLKGSLSEAHATASYGCTTSLAASGYVGKLQVMGTTLFQGPYASVTGPPEAQQSVQQTVISNPLGWPALTFGDSATAHVNSQPGGPQVFAEGEAHATNVSVGLQQVDGVPPLGVLGNLIGYKAWDFANPVVSIGTGTDPSTEAELNQNQGVSTADGEVEYPQINILPMNALTAGTPSAAQGLIFIRSFKAKSHSTANALTGGAFNTLTYSATIGMFNPGKPANCAGDGCYDLYTVVGPNNPIQAAVGLSSNPAYALQAMLFTQFTSATAQDINNAMFASSDGTRASISISSLMNLQIQYGSAIKLPNTCIGQGGPLCVDPSNLISLQGLIQLNLGSFDVSIQQNQ